MSLTIKLQGCDGVLVSGEHAGQVASGQVEDMKVAVGVANGQLVSGTGKLGDFIFFSGQDLGLEK